MRLSDKRKYSVKPCPICGTNRRLMWARQLIPKHIIFQHYSVMCDKCNRYGPERIGKRRAAKAWNEYVNKVVR